MKPESIEVKPVLSDDEAEILAARNAFARCGAEIAARRRAAMEVAATKAGPDGGVDPAFGLLGIHAPLGTFMP
ncbi:hypothetical protein LJ655_05895 [Paraburkholderia sp. MMS20-SJTN17]|uniref:Uncharacterized protein n=1 Tax=Paraburkholderia translucens TaxID=2886945 RepID=A0ABS8K9K5_9BURK|nr:hypothetical protein [Paraburkholderia sp. MMS20-SJTN17]MCC8401430.1 hypothetical protein [Paraburkholderia sp. MMS20-SJTN17]